MFNEINKSRNKFYTKLIKITAKKEQLNDEDITELLEAQDEFIDKILEFKYISDEIINEKNLNDIPHVAIKFNKDYKFTKEIQK